MRLRIFVFVLVTGESLGASVPGHVEGWGNNSFGQATPPPGLDGVVAVAGGGEHSLALRVDGTVVAWGHNPEGQTVIPSGLHSVQAIAAAGHCVALRSNGTLMVWGSNLGAVTNVPAGLSNVVGIATGNIAGNPYTTVVRSDGSVVAWGAPCCSSWTNVPAGLSGVVQVAAGSGHALALKNDGTVIGWGDNFAGAATPPPGLSGVVVVRAGQFSSLALKADGTVVKWGAFPDVPADVDSVADVQLGGNHALAVRSNGMTVAWGSPSGGTVPDGLTGVTAIAAGGNHSLVVTARPLIGSISPPVVANAGDTVMFSVTATGSPLSYQWRRNGADLPGAIHSTITLPNVQAGDAGTYLALVSNPYGSTPSPPTALSFPAPVVDSQPQSVVRYRGGSASLEVVASGLAPLSYQWLKAGANLPGATMPSLTWINLGSTNAGSYQAVVIDAAGSRATSAVAMLTIVDPTVTNAIVLTPAADTTLHSSGTKPLGVSSIIAGTRNNGILDRALVRFQLGSIPSSAVIQSADLRLTVIMVPERSFDSNFSVHRMLRSWGLDATWAQAAGGAPWSTPGGLSGVDYAAASSAARFVTVGGMYDLGPTSQMAADVQTWLAHPDANHGWMLKTESEGNGGSARHFGSSESAQTPQLLLQYATPAPPARITNVMVEAGNLTFHFVGAAGWLYRIECRDNVESGAWTTATNVPAGPANTIEISIPVTAPRRFYRVIAE